MNQMLGWGLFFVLVVAMMALDMGVFHRKAHEIHIKEALGWTAFWVAIALLFCAGIYVFKGQEKALEFLAGYLVEESLSVDNLFVFLLIFNYFSVPPIYQHKALFWGIIGALVMRAFFIAAGIVLINKFHWLIYVFGAFLVYTAFNIAIGKDKEVHPNKNPILKLLHKVMPVDNSFSGEAFFIKKMGRYHATPLFAVVLVFGPTDLMFAIDSIPAVLAITSDPFIVYTSNVFALMGLRSIFFALAGLMRIFHYINYGLAVILSFVGAKMLLTDVYKISVALSLGVIATVLLISIIASIIHPHKIAMVIDPAENPASKVKRERS